MADFSEDEWFRGMATAAYTLAIATVEGLLSRGDIERSEAAAIMASALAAATARQPTKPEYARLQQATSFHLQTAAKAVDQFAAGTANLGNLRHR